MKNKRDNLGRYLNSNIDVWEAGVGHFEHLPPEKMLFEMGFDPQKYEYVKSWLGKKGKKQTPTFYIAVKNKKK